ncbi:hypothetical protein C3747_5g261 [Trypanosoma cruzi]|uniref:Uncharacterized protein n=1 Tax=Trypanosoma cruzi TaxID=5693 RepID=A0A2V2XIR8_TRYCR|nr:hypothetical protein C3747_5g261 [Trypanosoma cruzi]
MQSLLVGCVHRAFCTTAARRSHRVRLPFTSKDWKCSTATAALHRSAHAHQRRILLSTWPPVQHLCGGSLGSVQPHNTNASHFSDVLRTCVPLPTRNLCRRPCVKGGDINPASEDAVINGLRRVCNTIGTPYSHNRAPPIQHRIFPWDTVSCNKVEFNQPRFAQDASDDVKRTAIDSIYSSLGAYDFELWTDVSSSLAELASGSAALLYGSTTTNDLPVEVHRAAAGRLACSYRAECLAIENGIIHLIPFCLETSQSPTRILVATDSLSGITPHTSSQPQAPAALQTVG